MADSEGNSSFSLNAFIEQTARMLRDAIKAPSKKKRIFSKENGLSHTNKIKQIARMLRHEIAKRPKRKKRKR